MKTLVTGASGFLGKYVIRNLVNSGFDVVALSKKSIIQESPVHWIQADFLDSEQMRTIFSTVKPEFLVHLAWQANYYQRWGSDDNLRSALGSIKLIEEFARNGGKRAIVAGTCAEYDWKFGYCSEDKTPSRPTTIYGKCKDIAREMAQAICTKYQIELVWARVFFAYGYGERIERLIPYTVTQLIEGQTIECTHGNQIRDYIHAEEVASCIKLLLETDDANGIYNIASGEPLRIKDIVNLCASKFSSVPEIKFGAIPSPLDDPAILLADISKIQTLGWSPSQSNQSRILDYVDKLKSTVTNSDWLAP